MAFIAQVNAASYSFSAQVLGGFGGKQRSPTYSQRSTGAEVIALNAAGAASGHYHLRPGHIGQNVEIRTLNLGFEDTPTDSTIAENTSRRLRMAIELDDDTVGDLSPTDLSWRVVSGMLTAPNTTGELYAGAVSADASATIEGTFQGVKNLFTVLIMDVVASYSDWQTNYFTSTEINTDPATSPETSFAGDGVANLTKYALGLNPRIIVTGPLTPVLLVGGRLALSFNRQPRPDLVFQVEASEELRLWKPIWTATGEMGPTGAVTVQDTETLTAAMPRRFLRLKVSKN